MKTFRSVILVTGLFTTGCAGGAQTVRDFYPPIVPEASEVNVQSAQHVDRTQAESTKNTPSLSTEGIAQL